MANSRTGSQSVENMIDIDGTLSSSVEGYETYGLLYDHKFSLSKTVGSGAGGLLDTSAKIEATPLIIKIASGVYISDMENNFIMGRPFLNVTIAKLANVNGTNQVRETDAFQNCFILQMQPSNDPKTSMNFNTLSLRFTAYTNTVYAYDDVSGELKGQNETTYDFAKNIIG